MFILDGFWDKVGGAIVDALRSLMLSLCDIIYKLIVFFFDVFMELGNAQILSEITISEFYTRVGLILGLFMIFRVTFSLIQYVINPDLMVDKQKGLFNIVKRIFIVVVLLGVTRPIFNFAYDIQKQIIESNVIPSVVTGKKINTSDSAVTFAWYTFNAFYDFDQNYKNSVSSADLALSCYELNSGLIEDDFRENHTLRYAYNCVNKREQIAPSDFDTDQTYSTYIIDFDGHGILAVGVGLLMLFMIIMYVVQVAVRVVQLGYLQLIAPIPIIGYLAPKGEDTLNKWFKQCVTTYLDFFIRVAILYFVVFIINFLTDTSSDNYNTFVASLGEFGESNLDLIIVIMIIALLLFASKVPKLLKEVFPSLGGSGAASFDFGLNPKKVFNDTLAARAIGAVGGAVGAGASNAVHGYMNMKKAFKDNGGFTSGKAWTSALGAGLKGTASVAGGVLGGARAGLKTKDITKVGEAVKTANKNRTERELKAEAGYHWYNPLPAIGDKILEYSGESGAEDRVKNRQQAIRDEKKRQSDLEIGERLYNSYSKVKSDGSKSLDADRAFKNTAYKESYAALGKAKGEAKTADLALTDAQAELSAARVSGDEARIARAKENYDIAYGNSKAMQGKLELAKAKHDSNKKIYADDAEIEDKYKYYADTHAEAKILENDVSSKDNSSHQTVNNEASYETVMQEYVNKDEEVSQANIEVANAIAKNPGTEAVDEAREKFVVTDQARDELTERLADMNASSTIETNIPNVSVNTSGLTKAELRKIKNNLEKRYRDLDRQYALLENQSMNGQPIDAAQLSKIKAERQAINKELEKVYIELNK